MPTVRNALAGGALAAALFAAGAASANITYSVNRTIGAGGVTGTITTDGATGVLATGDFVDWNLTLKGAGGATFNLDSGNSGVLVGNSADPFNPNAGNSDVTADASHIYFNFDGSDKGYLGFQHTPFFTGQHYWCLAAANESFDCVTGAETVAPVAFADTSTQMALESGNQIIASVGSAPEPSTWAMMLLGVASVGAVFRRRRLPATA
jgi:hypothetical protein